MKPYFISPVAFCVVYTLQLINLDLHARIYFIPLVMILFFGTLLLFAIEYERMGRTAWSKKEKKLIADTYTKFFEMHISKKNPQEAQNAVQNLRRELLKDHKTT